MLFVHSGSKALIHSILVVVEPLAFLLGQHLHKDGRGEDGAEGQVFEGVIGSESDAFGGGNDKHGVFVTYAVASFDVDAGFIGDDHAWEQRGGAPLHTELVKPNAFVDGHERRHALYHAGS